MGFKQIIYCLVAFLISFSIGLLISPGLADALKLPQKISILMMVSFFIAVLGTVIFYGVGTKLKKLTDSTDGSEDSQSQQWAWLKPAGMATRSPYPVNKEQIIIGRDITCDILICNDSISRRHAEVIRSPEGWRVHDLNSANGTFLNGQRIEEADLASGDVITLGDINLTFDGPSVPVIGTNPETVSSMPLDPGMGLDTQVHTVQTHPHTVPTMPVGEIPDTQISSPPRRPLE